MLRLWLSDDTPIDAVVTAAPGSLARLDPVYSGRGGVATYILRTLCMVKRSLAEIQCSQTVKSFCSAVKIS